MQNNSNTRKRRGGRGRFVPKTCREVEALFASPDTAAEQRAAVWLKLFEFAEALLRINPMACGALASAVYVGTVDAWRDTRGVLYDEDAVDDSRDREIVKHHGAFLAALCGATSAAGEEAEGNETKSARAEPSDGRPRISVRPPKGATRDDMERDRIQVFKHGGDYLSHLGILDGDLLLVYRASDEAHGDLVVVENGEHRCAGFLNIGSTFEMEVDTEAPRGTLARAVDDEEREYEGWTFKPHEVRLAGRVVEVRRADTLVAIKRALRAIHEGEEV